MGNTRTITITDYTCWITLEVNPREITIDSSKKIERYDLIEGEYVSGSTPNAEIISISTFIPNDESDLHKGHYSQDFIINRLEYWNDHDIPVYVYVGTDINNIFIKIFR